MKTKSSTSITDIPGLEVSQAQDNSALTKTQAATAAQMAQDGLARIVRPAHTMLDGDMIFALSTGNQKCDTTIIGAFAAEAVSQAIARAVKMSASAGGLPRLNK